MIYEEHIAKAARKYPKFLKGKRVMVVGPAGYLVGSGKGAEIDAHDVVVRLNNSFPLPAELREDIGSRTDVLYHTCGRIKKILNRVGNGADGIEILQKDGVRWLVAKHHPFRASFKNKAKTQRFLAANEGRIQTLCVVPRILGRIQQNLMGTDPNMGTLAIAHLLRTSVEELSICGIDFGASGYYPGYTLAPGYSWNETRTRVLKSGGEKKKRGPHDKQKQIRFLARLFEGDGRVKIDERLRTVLERGRE